MENALARDAGPGDDALLPALREMGLVGSETPRIVPLTGGVSSLIVRVEAEGRIFCAKGALAKLKVAADWRAPVRRNRAEAAWMREASLLVPGAVPAILGEAPMHNVFAMEWLSPEDHPVWKTRLLAGDISPSFAGQVGTVIGRIHAGTAGRPELAARFANADDFDALRLDPYLRATAQRHPAIGGRLRALADRTSKVRLALIHGDVSPKNILAGPDGPVLLDAECATYGDPAFDLAFCLNHFLLKSVHLPAFADPLGASFAALAQAYLAGATWESVGDLERRAVTLLPALALARVDGKSPVEYLDEAGRDAVRRAALALGARPPSRLGDFFDLWKDSLQ